MSKNICDTMHIRQAVATDTESIAQILKTFSEKKLLLQRRAEEILQHVDQFWVADYKGRCVGCATLRQYDSTLFEVRSLAVDTAFQNQGIGSALVSHCLKTLQPENENIRVFALTYRADFFCHLGFELISKSCFPEKIWSDCRLCAKRNCCDEEAVVYYLSKH